MRKTMGNRRYDAQGFTIIEVMIVVAIIGILASISIPQFQRFTNKSKRTEAFHVLQAVYSAEISYFGTFDKFPGESLVISESVVLKSLGLPGIDKEMKFYNRAEDNCSGNCFNIFSTSNDVTKNQGFLATLSGSIDRDNFQDFILIKTKDYAELPAWTPCPAGAPYLFLDDLTNSAHPCL